MTTDEPIVNVAAEAAKLEYVAVDNAVAMAMVDDLAPYDIELHLSTNPDLPKKYGKAIKAAGGAYTEARGNGCLHRYVTLPRSARELIDKLVHEFGAYEGTRPGVMITMIARASDKLPAPVAVIDVSTANEHPLAAFERILVYRILRWRVRHGEFVPVTNAEIATVEKAAADARAVEIEKRKVAERLYAAMPRTLAEFDALVEALTQFVENNGDLDDADDVKGLLAGWKAKTAAAQALLDRCVEQICKQTE